MPIDHSKENIFHSLEFAFARRSKLLAPFSLKAHHYRRFRKRVNFFNLAFISEFSEKKRPGAADDTESVPWFTTLPLGDGRQRDTSTPATPGPSVSTGQAYAWPQFPPPIIALPSSFPAPLFPNIGADDHLVRTPPPQTHFMAGLFTPCSNSTPSTPSKATRRSSPFDDESPSIRRSKVRRTNLSDFASRVSESPTHTPAKSFQPTQTAVPIENPDSAVSHEKQLEEMTDAIVDVLEVLGHKNAWTLLSSLYEEMVEREPQWTQFDIGEAVKDNVVLKMKSTQDGQACQYDPINDLEHCERMERIRGRRAARLAKI